MFQIFRLSPTFSCHRWISAVIEIMFSQGRAGAVRLWVLVRPIPLVEPRPDYPHRNKRLANVLISPLEIPFLIVVLVVVDYLPLEGK